MLLSKGVFPFSSSIPNTHSVSLCVEDMVILRVNVHSHLNFESLQSIDESISQLINVRKRCGRG